MRTNLARVSARVSHHSENKRLDPTGCMDLRRKLLTIFRRSVARWRSDLHRIIVGEDVLGLGSSLIFMGPSDQMERFSAYARGSTSRSFNLRADVSALMHKVYIRGFLAAYGELKREATTPSLRASSLYVFQILNDVNATIEATLQQMVHTVSIGVTALEKPSNIYRRALKVLKKISLPRLSISGQTLITQAYAHAKLDAYAELGVQKVRIQAEHVPAKLVMDARLTISERTVTFKTAGDAFVCSTCEDLEDEEYTIAEARGIIPVHPNCRCSFVRTEE